MNVKAWAPLAVAVVLGLVAAITAKNLVSKRPAAAAGAGHKVVVANKSVLPGQALSDEDLAVAPLAWGEMPEGTFTDKNGLVGRVAVMPMVKGQPVLESLLAASGAGAGLQALVPEGMRAITIEVNEYSAVAGLVAPGCSVDVVATMQDGERREMVARTVVQNVKVMAVGQRVAANAPVKDGAKTQGADGPVQEIFKSVTLLATPEEAEALELASQAGRPRLVLRGTHDSSAAVTNGVTMSNLVGRTGTGAADLLAPPRYVEVVKNPAAPASQPAILAAVEDRVIKVIRGGQETTVRLKDLRAIPVQEPAVAGADASPAVNR